MLMAVGDRYEFSGGYLTLLKADIILIEYSNEMPITAEHIQATRDLRKELIGDNPYFPIIDMRKGFVTFTKEAKKWVAENSESAKIRIMDVFLVPNWGMKLEAMLYLKVFKPKVPTKVVRSLEEAYKLIQESKPKLQGVA